MDFQIARKLHAPIQDVWDAWTTASQLEKWYSPGPVNWVVDQLDVRPGGKFRMHMDTPNGEHVAEGSFHEVQAPHKLSQGPDDGSMTIHTFLEETEEGTHMVVSMDGLPEDQHEMMQGAWSAGFDKLEKLLG